MLRRTTQLAVAGTLVAAAAAFAPAAHASRVGFDVSIGGPGYAVTFGNGPYYPYYHRYHRYYYAPAYAPVYVAPPVVYEPPVVYAPPRVVYAPPRVVYRAPYARRVIVDGPVYYRY